MHLKARTVLLLAAAAFVVPATAHAGVILPGTYQLLDHGDGSLGPDYGLRVDAIGEVFSVEIGSADVILDWDGGVTATITGTLNQNTAGGNGGIGPVWDVEYTLTGVVAVGTQGFTATGGTGTLTDPFNVVTNLVGEQDGDGFAFIFLADGHRLAGDNDTPVARGWLLPPGSTDDWIVRATVIPIPEPGTALLLGLGLVGLAAVRPR